MTDQEKLKKYIQIMKNQSYANAVYDIHDFPCTAYENIMSLISQLTQKDKQIEERTGALDWMSRAFDPERPDKCHQDCFNASDGHGYEMQDIALSKCRQALKDWKEQ